MVGRCVQVENCISRRHGFYKCRMDTANLTRKDKQPCVILQLPIIVAVDRTGEDDTLIGNRL